MFKFVGEAGQRPVCGEQIAEIIRWKASILNMEKYFGVCRSIQMDVMSSHDRTKRDDIDISMRFCSISIRAAQPRKGAHKQKHNKAAQLETRVKGKLPLKNPL